MHTLTSPSTNAPQRQICADLTSSTWTRAWPRLRRTDAGPRAPTPAPLMNDLEPLARHRPLCHRRMHCDLEPPTGRCPPRWATALCAIIECIVRLSNVRLRPSIELIRSGSSVSWRRWVRGGGSPLLLIPPRSSLHCWTPAAPPLCARRGMTSPTLSISHAMKSLSVLISSLTHREPRFPNLSPRRSYI
jgi:hypothetical protein